MGRAKRSLYEETDDDDDASGIYGDNDTYELSRNQQQVVVAVTTLLVLFFMAIDVTGPEVVFFVALMFLCLLQILTITETLAGFSNESMITIGTLFLVIGVVEKSHVVDWFARKAFGSGGPAWWGKLRMYVTCFLLSCFFNNTPLVAILMPVVKDWGRTRGIAASQLLIPLSYSVLAGSFGTMIGTSTNLTVQGLVDEDRGYTFPFFAPFPIGLACFCLLLPYQLVAAHYLLPHHNTGMLSQARDRGQDHVAEVYVSEHSVAVGRTLKHTMNSLGIAPNNCFKIRRAQGEVATGLPRKLPSGIILPQQHHLEGISPEQRKEAWLRRVSTSMLDKTYLKSSAKFWFKQQPDLPDRLDEGGDADAATGLHKKDDDDVERNGEEGEPAYFDIIAPSLNERIHAGDVVFISSAENVVKKMMVSIMGESRGLFILRGNVLSLPGFGTELVECVVSDTNPFVGTRVADIAPLFAETYKAGLVTVRGKNWGHIAEEEQEEEEPEEEEKKNTDDEEGGGAVVAAADADADEEEAKAPLPSDDSEVGAKQAGSKLLLPISSVSVSELVLQYGDTILCVTERKNLEDLRRNRDFFVISTVGSLPVPLNAYSFTPVVIFLVMLVAVAAEYVRMCPAALATTACFFLGGWIKPKDIPKLVDIRLLVLMGCALSYSRAVSKTGLADRIASSIQDADPSNFGAIMLVYGITLLFTETISNNAAAALMYPIAVALADQLEVDFKPFAMTVLVASTSCFMSPIGYQTHTMVWGPGGYKFRDYVTYGFIPDLLYWITACLIIVRIYPF